MRRALEPEVWVEPTVTATGSISQLSEKPGRRKRRLPFGFQPPKPKRARKR